MTRSLLVQGREGPISFQILTKEVLFPAMSPTNPSPVPPKGREDTEECKNTDKDTSLITYREKVFLPQAGSWHLAKHIGGRNISMEQFKTKLEGALCPGLVYALRQTKAKWNGEL